MAGRVCHHCKELVEEGEPHGCWITTEAALTRDLSEDLRDAWERLRETAVDFGEQRIYASHHCIMFSKKACYFFVRPRRSALEVVFFLGRRLAVPQIRRTAPASQTKIAHIVHITHRDQVEAPVTDWLHEAYESSDALSARPVKAAKTRATAATKKTAAKNIAPRKKTTAKRAAAKKPTVRKASR
jgi:hypothetical protein